MTKCSLNSNAFYTVQSENHAGLLRLFKMKFFHVIFTQVKLIMHKNIS